MMPHRRSIARAFCATLALGAFAAPACAQDTWPNRLVRVVVPYAPGGSADTLGRLISRHLSETFKQSFVVENRGGAGGVIGSQMVARAEPDGYTLVVSGIGSHVVAPLTNASSFDPIKDFTHIALLGGPPTVLAVNVAQPIKDVPGFIKHVKSLPEGLSWASPGQGTHGALIGEAFRQVTHLNLVHISYKGAGPAVADVAANQVPAAFITLSTAAGNIKSGKLRPLAVTSAQRIVDFPDIPTFKELGYPQLTGTTWFSLSGPAGMPADLVQKLNVAVRKALQSPEGQAELRAQNMETFDWDAPTFNDFVKKEIAHWSPYIKQSQATK
ncbi:MAG: tripartite tricarboxylate transporter substrate binding protein [Pigmentiphaga sp.]|uniref:Bug family tripartite tricarboxylate transporter substrate binding protein n=1 Tax=Pigmentiphaga sp. TaxID=1977564 RepID=UPI0029A8602D|nr:tripartite tricarboxylate transporter substrate binding protein [Pigmentiphaga sp.]MDX3906250.1 tripartite tricarboxylate transporter substrate binding protein [Pigmentiphaga sp.]